MKREGIDFKEALNKLADRAGVKVESFVAEKPEIKEAHEHLRVLLEDAIIYYRTHLFNNKDILAYLHEKRGLTDATIETFGLGYAPPGYDNLLKQFLSKGYSEKDLVDAGMVSVREADDSRNAQNTTRVYDKFRNRIMIPIRDENGKMAGFGARIVDPNDIPKFLNSPETPIFSKGHILYGLDRARKPIRAGRPGCDRGRLSGCDRVASGGLRECGLADGDGTDRRPTAFVETFHAKNCPCA